MNDPLYNHVVFGPTKGKGGIVGKTDDTVLLSHDRDPTGSSRLNCLSGPVAKAKMPSLQAKSEKFKLPSSMSIIPSRYIYLGLHFTLYTQ